MGQVFFENIMLILNALKPEWVWLIEFFIVYASVLLMLRFFGASGLYAFIVLGIIGANIQVLKIVQFGVYAHPVAMGTILFTATYLATDILCEYFGKEYAKKAVWLGFAGFLLSTIFMLINLGYAPLTPEQAGEEMGWALGTQDALKAILLPQPVFFIASMTAYLLSQFNDIWIFRLVRKKTSGKYLWLRNNASTMLSALIDNTVFSALAFYILAADPVGMDDLIFTFILGTYLLRLVIAVMDTPFIYIARHCLPKDVKKNYTPAGKESVNGASAAILGEY